MNGDGKQVYFNAAIVRSYLRKMRCGQLVSMAAHNAEIPFLQTIIPSRMTDAAELGSVWLGRD